MQLSEAENSALHERGWRVGLALLLLSAPIVASTVSRTAMSFVDFLMVSQLGAAAQAAVVPATLLIFTGIGFGLGVLSLVSTFVSQSLGRGDLRECSAYAWQGVWISGLFALIGLPLFPFVDDLFLWIGHEPEVARLETIYVQIGILGLFPMLASAAVTNFFNGIHQPAIGLWSTIAANVFNIAGNYVLIWGHFGFPELGIAGAAISTQLAALLQTLILIGWMMRPAIARRFHVLQTWRPDVPRLMAILKNGAPAGLHFSMDIGAFTIFTVFLIGQFGTVHLAAHNIVMKLFEVSFMPTIGLGMALTAAVGKAIGEKRAGHARLLTWWGAGIGGVYMALVALVVLLFRHEIAEAFAADGPLKPEIIAWASSLLILCAVYQAFDALFIVHIHALRGAGDNNVPAVIAGVLAASLLIGGGWLVATIRPEWGVVGPWIAGTVYVMVLGLAMMARWLWGPWERIDLFKHQPDTPLPAAA